MKRIVLISVLFSFVFLSHAQIWKVPEGHETRWTSFENPTGAKGTAAQANKGAKGSAFGRIMAGDSCVLLSQQGPGLSATAKKDLRSLPSTRTINIYLPFHLIAPEFMVAFMPMRSIK